MRPSAHRPHETDDTDDTDDTDVTCQRLRGFRRDFHSTLTGWADAAFELTDAALCAPAPVSSVPTLSLEPAFRRSHGSLYKALARGGVDADAMRDLLIAHRPADWPLVFAVDESTWARCDAETSPGARVLLLGVQALGRAANRGRLVVSVDHRPGLGMRLVDRAHGRDPDPTRRRRRAGHHHPTP